jgi:hypothetical protein
LFEFKRKSGHCMVPGAYEQDKSLGQWVNTQRRNHNKNTMRPDRKELLDKIGFAWKYITLAARASTTDVRGLVIVSFHTFVRQISMFLTLVMFPLICMCRIRIRKRSPGPAVWVSQTIHHQKKRNHNKATLEINILLPVESDEVAALPKPD